MLQENLHARGTIRENIAAAHRRASLDEVIAAATIAAADEIIRELPMSYDTKSAAIETVDIKALTSDQAAGFTSAQLSAMTDAQRSTLFL